MIKEVRAIIIHGMENDSDHQDITDEARLEFTKTFHFVINEKEIIHLNPINKFLPHVSDKNYNSQLFQNNNEFSYIFSDGEDPSFYSIGLLVKNFDSYKNVKKAIKLILEETGLSIDLTGSKKAARSTIVQKPANGISMIMGYEIH